MRQAAAYSVSVSLFALMLAAYAFGFLDFLFPRRWEDTASMFRDLIAACFGVFFAIQAERLRKHWNDEERRIALLESLKAAFGHNAKLMQISLDNLNSQPPLLPSFPPDLGLLDGLRVDRQELLGFSELRSKIDEAEYELVHVNRRFELLLASHFATPNIQGTITLVYGARQKCKNVEEMLDDELRRQPRSRRWCHCQTNS